MFFLFTFYNKEEKMLRIFKKKIADFQEFNFFLQNYKPLKHIFSLINLLCGLVMSHKKFGPDRLSLFDVYWAQTDRQTPKQTSQIYI